MTKSALPCAAANGVRRRTVSQLLFGALGLATLVGIGHAQGSYEIQVYGSETTPPGATMVELHSVYTADGVRGIQNGVYPNHHALHETLEVTQGFTPWFEVGAYVFSSIQPGAGWQWVGDHIRPRVRVPEEWQWPVGVGLSGEIGYVRRVFSEDRWGYELRPIVDKHFGPVYVSFNPAFERALTGPNASEGFDFAPSVKVSYDLTKRVSVGTEYYADLGPVRRLEAFSNQQHQLMPAIDIEFAPKWEFNFGVGIGLNHSTDRWVLKMIVGRQF